MFLNPGNQIFSQDEDGSITITNAVGTITISKDNLSLIDIYGNTFTMTDMCASYQQNSPTYEELYEHWLKTKQND